MAIADSPDETDDEFDHRLQEFVGLESGPAQTAPDAVNVPMIRHWCEAAGDNNPVYLDEVAAAASVHGGIVAPPTLLQAWVMNGFGAAPATRGSPGERLTALLRTRGFTSVVATNCEQTYHRYLRPGDRLTMRSTIESVSPQKRTALGDGHFVTTRSEYLDASGELVASMRFRIIRFRPAPQRQAEAPAAVERPGRPQPATTVDNAWWFEALDGRRLLIQRCSRCGRLRHPAGPMCPACQSLGWDTIEASGRGVVHSFVVTHHPRVPGLEYPLPIVLVDLAEGVRMVMNAADTATVDIRIGAAVTIEVLPVGTGRKLPFAIIHTAGEPTTVEGHP